MQFFYLSLALNDVELSKNTEWISLGVNKFLLFFSYMTSPDTPCTDLTQRNLVNLIPQIARMKFKAGHLFFSTCWVRLVTSDEMLSAESFVSQILNYTPKHFILE